MIDKKPFYANLAKWHFGTFIDKKEVAPDRFNVIWQPSGKAGMFGKTLIDENLPREVIHDNTGIPPSYGREGCPAASVVVTGDENGNLGHLEALNVLRERGLSKLRERFEQEQMAREADKMKTETALGSMSEFQASLEKAMPKQRVIKQKQDGSWPDAGEFTGE